MSPLLLLISFTACPATLAQRDSYTVCYDSHNQRALWTSHTPQPSSALSPRKYWRIDHELNSLPPKAFTNTGFDRGHLASSADLPNSTDTYLTSNAIAQDPKLYRGAWRRLESDIRKLRPTQVVTGAIYNGCGNEAIEAPCVVYKIAFLENGQILAHFAQNAQPIQKPVPRESPFTDFE